MTSDIRTEGFVVHPFQGHNYTKGDRRIVCFLENPIGGFVNAKKEFEGAGPDVQKAIRYAVQQWLQEAPFPKRHHGWNQSQHGGLYTRCYVFKHVPKGVRCYGIIYNPQDEPRLQICCIVHFGHKFEDDADTNILADLNRILDSKSCRIALEYFFKGIQNAGA